MSVTFEETLILLEQIQAKARLGAQATATAMAEFIAEVTREETLRRRTHAPGAYYRSKPGDAPSSASGSLADGMYTTPAGSGLRVTAYVGNRARHARVLEEGCVLQPTSKTHLGWKDSGRADNPGGWWRHRSVTVPPHPFLRPTVEDAIADGSLRRVAIDAFRPYDP